MHVPFDSRILFLEIYPQEIMKKVPAKMQESRCLSQDTIYNNRKLAPEISTKPNVQPGIG